MKRENILLVLVLMFFMLFPSCNKLENETTSGTVLYLNSITGNDLEGNDGSTTIFVDVLYENPEDGTFTIYNDNAVAELAAVLIDPDAEVSSYYQNVIVDQIDIEYTRSDGLDTEGKDVIYSFSQKVSFVVEVGGTSEIPFVLVQHASKLESPLVELVNFGQEKILKLEAKVTIHGKDVGGHRVAPVVGSVSVWIANFGNEE